MNSYNVSRASSSSERLVIPYFSIEHYYEWPRTEGYAPKTEGRLFLREGKGFELEMWCFEENPRALYHNPNDPVHTDSCMEAFIWFYPELPASGYLGVEMNANGASHCSFGTGRHTRGYVLARGLAHPEIVVDRLEIDGQKLWRARTLIHLSLIEALYGRCDFASGHKMRANFYKCGDHTDPPHWGSWNRIGERDFHLPEYFGDLILE